jgi:hypothetical protein
MCEGQRRIRQRENCNGARFLCDRNYSRAAFRTPGKLTRARRYGARFYGAAWAAAWYLRKGGFQVDRKDMTTGEAEAFRAGFAAAREAAAAMHDKLAAAGAPSGYSARHEFFAAAIRDMEPEA